MVGLGVLLFGVTGRDDVFKTFWSAYSLSEFGAILNYNGVPLEQSSSLLEVLILGGLRALFGGDIVVYGYGLGIMGGIGTILLAVRLGKQLGLSDLHQAYLPWLVATSSFLVYWSFSGMETSLQCCCILAMLSGILSWLEGGSKWIFAIALLCFLLCRPENAFLLLGGLTLAIFLIKRYRRAFMIMLAYTAAGTILLLLVRVACFNLWFPLPVHAKASGLSLVKFYHGGGYLYKIILDHPYMVVLILAIGLGVGRKLKQPQTRSEHLLPILFLGLGLTMVMLVGGDWMENGRFVVPFIPLGLLCLPELGKWNHWLLTVILVVQLAGIYWTARYQSTGRPLWTENEYREQTADQYPFFVYQNRIHARDIGMVRELDKMLDFRIAWEGGERPIRVLSQQAGMVAYYTAVEHYGQIEFIDLVGLTSKHFHACPLTRDRGRGVGGLNMDLHYLYQSRESLGEACDFQMPDMVFDIDNERWEKLDIFQDNGVKPMARASGRIETHDAHFPGLEVRNEQFLVDGR